MRACVRKVYKGMVRGRGVGSLKADGGSALFKRGFGVVLSINISRWGKSIWRRIMGEVLQESCAHHLWSVTWPLLLAKELGNCRLALYFVAEGKWHGEQVVGICHPNVHDFFVILFHIIYSLKMPSFIFFPIFEICVSSFHHFFGHFFFFFGL